MKYIQTVLILLFCSITFSCAAKDYSENYVDINGSPEIVKTMVVKVVDLIQAEKGVETTTIRLLRKGNTPFDIEVLSELKRRGFALSDTEGIATNFVIDGFEKNKIYVSVMLDKTILSRIFIYEAQTGVIKPGSPLSKGEV